MFTFKLFSAWKPAKPLAVAGSMDTLERYLTALQLKEGNPNKTEAPMLSFLIPEKLIFDCLVHVTKTFLWFSDLSLSHTTSILQVWQKVWSETFLLMFEFQEGTHRDISAPPTEQVKAPILDCQLTAFWKPVNLIVGLLIYVSYSIGTKGWKGTTLWQKNQARTKRDSPLRGWIWYGIS